MKKPVAWIIAVVVAAAAASIVICAKVGRAPTQSDLEREFERMEPNDKELDDFNGEIPLGVVSGKKKGKAGARAAKAKAKDDGEDEPAAEPTEEEKAEAEAEKTRTSCCLRAC